MCRGLPGVFKGAGEQTQGCGREGKRALERQKRVWVMDVQGT